MKYFHQKISLKKGEILLHNGKIKLAAWFMTILNIFKSSQKKSVNWPSSGSEIKAT